jgi:hypothetical protein
VEVTVVVAAETLVQGLGNLVCTSRTINYVQKSFLCRNSLPSHTL